MNSVMSTSCMHIEYRKVIIYNVFLADDIIGFKYIHASYDHCCSLAGWLGGEGSLVKVLMIM